MGRYVFKRLIQMPLVLLVLITISFFMVRLAPGTPFSGERQMDETVKQALNEKYGLDDPWPIQYLKYLKGLATLDLGPSYKQKGLTVNEIIAEKSPVSAVLGLSALIVALVFGLTAGIISGIRQNSKFDHASMSVAMVGLTVPPFVVGPLLALLFGLKLGWFPVAGYERIAGPIPYPQYLVLPTLTLALPFAARIARLTRAGMLDVINQDYIRTAWAKGLRERVIVTRHALRGALLPVISFLGPGVAAMLTGSLVVEQIFQIPGIGYEFVKSALNRDYTLVLGTVILFGVLLVIFNLIVDILYGFLDPRIRYS